MIGIRRTRGFPLCVIVLLDKSDHGSLYSGMKRGISLVLLLVSTAVFSQTVIEKPVAFDGAGKVMVISRALRDQLKLFPVVGDFASARLLQSDATFVLEVTLNNGNRERTVLSADEADKLRQQVESSLAASPTSTINQKGRGLFLLSQLPIALAAYSPGLLAITRVSGTNAVALYMIGAAAFYFGPMYLTRHASMTEAQATMSVDYGYYGIFNSFALTTLFGMGNLFSSDDNTAWQGQVRAGVLFATSVGGQFLGYRLGRPFSLGQARYASLLTDCGMVDGLLLGTFVQTFNKTSVEGNSKVNSALTLVGSGAGGYLSYRLARQRNWTEGQAFITGLGSIFGPLVANGAFWTAAPNSAFDNHGLNYSSFLALAGNAAGTWYAQRVVRDVPITNGGAFIATGTTIGGGLLGGGIGYLISNAYSHNPSSTLESWRWIFGAGTLGVAGGFMLGVKLAKDVSAAAAYQGSLRVNLDLASVAAGAMTYASSRTFSAPRLVTISF